MAGKGSARDRIFASDQAAVTQPEPVEVNLSLGSCNPDMVTRAQRIRRDEGVIDTETKLGRA